ncbi:hypothetical protein HYW94_00540, partial [Candidatus Uhrbacteria bacterium]|nr:hypothetical protein [Candidatus Uhrbacteria bacterium]
MSGTDQARNCVKWIDDSKSNCWGLGVPISVVSGSAPLQQTRNTSCTVACVVPPTSGNSNTSYTCDGWNPAQCVLKDQGQDPQTRICTRANRNCVGDSSEDTTIDPSNPRKLRQSKDCAKCTTDSYSQCSDDATTQTNVCPNPSDGRTVERTGCIKFDCKESGSAEISTPTYTCDDETSVGSGSGFPPAVANATLRFIGSPTKKWRADTFLYNSGLQIGIGAGAIAPATILEISNAFDTSKTTQVRITDKNANPELQFQYGDGNAHWGLYVKNGSGEDKSLRFWNAKDLVKIDTDGKLHAEEFCIGADKTKCTKVWGSGGGSSQWSDITGGGIYYTGGNVGIGTKPTAETVGLLQIAKTGDRYSGIVFQESRLRLGLDNKNNSAIFAQGGDAELEVGAQGHISFTTGGIAGSATERMRINDKGNVGIGTTTPADLLTLSGTGKFVRVDENSTGNSGIV